MTLFGNVANPPANSWITSVTHTGACAIGNMVDFKDSLAPSVSDTGKRVKGHYAGSACQGSHPRKNPRTELTVIEDYVATKKRQTIGAFGEASTHEVVEMQSPLVDLKLLAD